MKRVRMAALVAACAFGSAWVTANPVTLNNGPGDGSVSITLDGYGSFGGAVGGEAGEATYDPVGALEAEDTTFESGVLIGLSGGGNRTALSTGTLGTGDDELPAVNVSHNGNTATSSFSQLGLNFSLTQTLAPLFQGTSRTGSVLVQTYTMTNSGTADINGLEVFRYIDGDLVFESPTFSNDGGGRLIANDGTEILFETDVAEGTSSETTFFGITGEGGTIPGSGRFETSEYSELIEKIRTGGSLSDSIQGDGDDADQFVDAGEGYDITLAFRNLFNIAAGGTATYTTRTIFGNGAPEDVDPGEPPVEPPPPPPPGGVIPLPAGVWGGIALLSAMGGTSSLKRLRRRNA